MCSLLSLFEWQSTDCSDAYTVECETNLENPPSVSPACLDAAEDEEPTMGTFQSHTAPVTGLQVHGGLLYTCSEDNTARAYSLKVCSPLHPNDNKVISNGSHLYFVFQVLYIK